MSVRRSGSARFLRSRVGVVLVAFLGIAAFFLAAEHTAHVFGALPYLLLLACPLLHLFGHGGHGRHGEPDGHGEHNSSPEQRPGVR